METISGNCKICHHKTNILLQFTKDYIEIIEKIVPKKLLNNLEFDKNNIKICVICGKKLSIVLQQIGLIQSKKTVGTEPTKDRCQLCYEEENLLKLADKSLIRQCEGTVDGNKLLCVNCYYYLDIVVFVKKGLSKSFPKLENNKEKRKLSDYLLNLKPVSKSIYKIPKDIYNDLKLYKKVPYIDLTTNNNNYSKNNYQPKKIRKNSNKMLTPKFKIKLKKPINKTKRERKSRILDLNKVKIAIELPQNTSTPMKIDDVPNMEDETPKLNLSNNLSRRLSLVF